ncbi:acyl-CoA dehydrogenase C-terminal domain-containing protein [Flagellatimonas centrodinii]|uniref:acyl-CoA dehydrogenase C-terminal domain-containing protein n=1 Tax=Flagellatimonas centrodinii TaxID=2806210 RepID=UPI001FED6505|nr:acyl-CoA dehydrogenase C-terminal domain-containing protein [Flagellatimonas centrodinii]ULQ46721.1 acyl-CoA dehydrogenase C-terminal domain-containing protein [Flagellatimonas centrodinii]
MPAYKAPLRDTRFLLNEVFDFPAHYAGLSNGKDADPETVGAILEECARYCEEVLSPINLSGDQQGCTLKDGVVTTPKGFKDAYAQFVAGGWQGLSHPTEYGGQGLPMSLGLVKSEMMGTANWSFTMYPGLSLGCMNTIMQYASESLKNQYMPPLTEGRWSGTMCLTEPQCGTDLGQIKTKADDNGDGTYALTGTKIFISAGEHDLTENIIHIVLARLPDAPPGTRGISLFIVPKVLVNDDGSLGERNAVTCASIEHKMGIKASATCVLNFDGARAWLIGEPNKGLEAMFTFMNTARIGTAVQGVAHAELSFQGALPYALERRSMRALSGKKEPDKVADALIHHADVRRMLLTQKAIAEGGRAMIYFAAQYADHMVNGIMENDPAKYALWDDKLGFFTPILKGFLTEMGLEAANLGMQVFGGHGYISEHGMEQIARDARIATLYEGTTGIQALDLLGRKVLLTTRGACVREFTGQIGRFVLEHVTNGKTRRFCTDLGRYAAEWNVLTLRLMMMARKDRDVVSSASHHFLMYSGYVMMGYFWAVQAAVAAKRLAEGGDDTPEFYQSKLDTAAFYFDHLLPRAKAHAASMTKPSKSMTRLAPDHFAFS